MKNNHFKFKSRHPSSRGKAHQPCFSLRGRNCWRFAPPPHLLRVILPLGPHGRQTGRRPTSSATGRQRKNGNVWSERERGQRASTSRAPRRGQAPLPWPLQEGQEGAQGAACPKQSTPLPRMRRVTGAKTQLPVPHGIRSHRHGTRGPEGKGRDVGSVQVGARFALMWKPAAFHVRLKTGGHNIL